MVNMSETQRYLRREVVSGWAVEQVEGLGIAGVKRYLDGSIEKNIETFRFAHVDLFAVCVFAGDEYVPEFLKLGKSVMYIGDASYEQKRKFEAYFEQHKQRIIAAALTKLGV